VFEIKELTFVNDCFKHERNEEIGVLSQALSSMAKKYKVIIKINNNPDGYAYCIKYRVNDLLKLTKFLDKSWTQWKWFNVYSNLGTNKGEQIANFTKNNRPKSGSIN
jgi:hypothetical protein